MAKVVSHSKAFARKAILDRLSKQNLAYGLMTNTPPCLFHYTIVDFLQTLNKLPSCLKYAHQRMSDEMRPVARPSMYNAIREISNNLSILFRSTKTVVLTIDNNKHVPYAKAPTQRKRGSSSTQLPDYEVSYPPNATTKRMAKHIQNVRAIDSDFETVSCSTIDEIREAYRPGVSLFDLSDPLYLARYYGIVDDDCQELSGVQIDNVYRRVLELPFPFDHWPVAVSSRSGFRSTLVQFIMMCFVLIPELRPMIDDDRQELIVMGHYCTDELLKNHISQVYDLYREFGKKRTAEIVDQSPLGLISGEFYLVTGMCNDLGEADFQALYAIRYFQENCPDTAICVDYRTDDSDALWHVMWLLAKIEIDCKNRDSYLPIVYVSNKKPKTSELVYLSCNKLRDSIVQLIPVGDTHTRNLSDPIELWSFIVAVFSYASDYTIGFSGITIDKIIDTYLKYHSDYIGCLVNYDPEKDRVVLNCEAFNRFVIACYYSKYPHFFNVDGSRTESLKSLLELDLDTMISRSVQAIGKNNIKIYLDLDRLHKHVCTINIDEFSSFTTSLKLRAPPIEQISVRVLMLQYYIYMVHSAGEKNLDLPCPLTHGYCLIDKDLPLSSDNIDNLLNDDVVERLSNVRREYLLQQLENCSSGFETRTKRE